jgi:hypothetical protein
MKESVKILHTEDRDYLSFSQETLMRVMHKDLAKYKTPAVLSHREDSEGESLFVFESRDTAASDFYKEYRLRRIPVYQRSKGGAAA